MKYLLILLFLVGCSNGPAKYAIGDRVRTKNCTGYVTHVSDYDSVEDSYMLQLVECNYKGTRMTMNKLHVNQSQILGYAKGEDL